MFLHGGDYNPEQWIGNMELVKSDISKLKAANINTVTIGMFSWSVLEAQENKFNFEWLVEIMEVLEANDMLVILGTPTAARPHWLAQNYPETSRVNEHGTRELSGSRHNHCMQSPQFRDKSEIIIRKLIETTSRFNNIHSWHINNEFGGHCYCKHCQNKFQQYLQNQYKTIENLNNSWWNTFWSHNYGSFKEVIPPFAHGERTNTPLNINWEKFKTINHIDYYQFEYNLIREYSKLPITTNFHGDPFNFSLDYYEFGKHVDYISFDLYPPWNTDDNFNIAIKAKKELTIQNSLDISKDFYMMESTPGSTNWQDYTILKSDKLHKASTYLQLLAGSKSFLYFQLKQSRGSSEKYHGAVLDVKSDTSSRVYNYIKDFGSELLEIKDLVDLELKREVAIYYDWNNSSMLHFSEGPRNVGLGISKFHDNLFEYFNNVEVNVDYVYDEKYLEKYHTIIFPYAYNVKPEVLEKLKSLKNKNVIAFPLFNYVNNDDLLHTEYLPAQMTEQFGVFVSEFNAILEGNVIKSSNYEFEYISEVVTSTNATVVDKFDHEILNVALSKNTFDGSDYYYIAGVPTKESLITLLDNITDYKYQIGKKHVSSNAICNDQEIKLITNFGSEPIELNDVIWSNSESTESLETYDFAIVKK
ncbi:beta-galactosidase [Mollicutes bacterium LVI A0039]|nr:beta-galactosidase [Mollicutes bacterium LVI A0039]